MVEIDMFYVKCYNINSNPHIKSPYWWTKKEKYNMENNIEFNWTDEVRDQIDKLIYELTLEEKKNAQEAADFKPN